MLSIYQRKIAQDNCVKRADDGSHIVIDSLNEYALATCYGCGSNSVTLHASTAFTIGYGLTAAPPLGCTSKCKCGDVVPVEPR